MRSMRSWRSSAICLLLGGRDHLLDVAGRSGHLAGHLHLVGGLLACCVAQEGKRHDVAPRRPSWPRRAPPSGQRLGLASSVSSMDSASMSASFPLPAGMSSTIRAISRMALRSLRLAAEALPAFRALSSLLRRSVARRLDQVLLVRHVAHLPPSHRRGLWSLQPRGGRPRPPTSAALPRFAVLRFGLMPRALQKARPTTV